MSKIITRRNGILACAAGILAAPFIIPSRAEAATTETLALGAVNSWSSAGFTSSDFDSRASGSVVVATTAKDNSANLDEFGQIRISAEVGGTMTSSSVFLIYILEDNGGSVYGDGQSTGTVLPAIHQLVATINPRNGLAAGAAATGISKPFAMPVAGWKFAIANLTGFALDSSANAAVDYRTLNRKYA